jgi:osmotically-inducible protein OsmY
VSFLQGLVKASAPRGGNRTERRLDARLARLGTIDAQSSFAPGSFARGLASLAPRSVKEEAMKISKRRVGAGLAALCAAALVSAACAERQATDAEISSRVSQALESDADLTGIEIAVVSRDGVVTLTGVVPEPGKREEAEDVARGVEGVEGIQNQITVAVVRPTPGSPPPVGAAPPAGTPPGAVPPAAEPREDM